MANLFFPLLDILQNELLSHLQRRKCSDCFKEMPFAEPLDYVTGHTTRGRAENKPFRKKPNHCVPKKCYQQEEQRILKCKAEFRELELPQNNV